MFKIFVSYAQPELGWAMHLKTLLTAPTVSVFVAGKDLPAGASLSAEISRSILEADLVVVLWTRSACASQYVNKEVFVAATAGKAIIPIMLQPGTPLPPELGDIKYLDFAEDPATQLGWLKTDVDRRAQSKAVSVFVGGALIAFLGWGLLSGGAK